MNKSCAVTNNLIQLLQTGHNYYTCKSQTTYVFMLDQSCRKAFVAMAHEQVLQSTLDNKMAMQYNYINLILLLAKPPPPPCIVIVQTSWEPSTFLLRPQQLHNQSNQPANEPFGDIFPSSLCFGGSYLFCLEVRGNKRLLSS